MNLAKFTFEHNFKVDSKSTDIWSGKISDCSLINLNSYRISNQGTFEKITNGLINIYALKIPKGATKLYINSTYYITNGDDDSYYGFSNSLDKVEAVYKLGGFRKNATISIKNYKYIILTIRKRPQDEEIFQFS